MAQIDERLTGLLDALLRSSLAPIATRLDSAESQLLVMHEDRDPFAPQPDETTEERAFRQLDLLDHVVTGRIKLEIVLMERSLALSRELSAGLADRGPEAFATVMLTDEETAPDVAGGTLPGENLLTGARRERLERLLKAWKTVVEVARASIERTPEA